MIACWYKTYIQRFGEETENKRYQSKTIRGTKYVSYDAQLCPLIDKGQKAPNAQVTCQIVNRHSEERKSSSPDSQTLTNPV